MNIYGSPKLPPVSYGLVYLGQQGYSCQKGGDNLDHILITNAFSARTPQHPQPTSSSQATGQGKFEHVQKRTSTKTSCWRYSSSYNDQMNGQWVSLRLESKGVEIDTPIILGSAWKVRKSQTQWACTTPPSLLLIWYGRMLLQGFGMLTSAPQTWSRNLSGWDMHWHWPGHHHNKKAQQSELHWSTWNDHL